MKPMSDSAKSDAAKRDSAKSDSLRVEAQVEQAEQVGAWLRDFVTQFSPDVDESLLGRVELAVHELLVNSIVHGTTGEDFIDITATITDNMLAVEMTDRGPQEFDERSVAPRRDGEIAVGGYGLHIIKKVSSDLRYRRDGDKNIWTVVFALTAQAGLAAP